ncbi:hypothetical protein EXIGLDRAFT_769296 [Exidia glandulosa HHB12029]|uniref:RNA-binding domain-containing protein n=1 Tax=Exidia glandulosa HHB12029 TaxID=1314781 RepID=A0A166AI55_EXIGL|nr:hypothetical protein EXIGLDRAFT_769296 [Exidia glandulosa HHB12029]
MSASSPVPLDSMANQDHDPRYTNGGLTSDMSGDVRMPDDPEGAAPLGDDNHHAGTLDAQSSGDPTQSAAGDTRGPGSPHKNNHYHEPQPKPNKVYIGNLPEHTRESDLQSCFGKIGRISSIELKVGYGFVEFETTDAAEESVAKYHEGWFMGNKIKVEISRGRHKPKVQNEPGACFKCGQVGHWARECPNSATTTPYNGGGHVRNSYRPGDSLLGRISDGPRDYPPPPPPQRDYPPVQRDSYGADRYPPGGRYNYDYQGPPRDAPPPRDTRDYYNPNAPAPRAPPPPSRPPREYEDYGRRDYRGPPGPTGPPLHTDARAPHYPDYDRDSGYVRPPYGGPPPAARDGYDRPPYDRRAPPSDRYGPPPPIHRPRTPPGPPPPRGRDGYVAPRDYPPPPAAIDYRRPPSPGPGPGPGPRYDYQQRPDNRGGYRPRGRSHSPPPRAGGPGYRNYEGTDSAGGFGPPSDRVPYGGGGGGAYAGNGYSSGPPIGMPPMSGHARPAGGRDRDGHYVPRPGDRGNDAPGYARRP